jgi:hypothetical protein
VKDLDVIFFDIDDSSPTRDLQAEQSLRDLAPDLPWQAKNQAAVHLWYKSRFGIAVEPLASIADAVRTFPRRRLPSPPVSKTARSQCSRPSGSPTY